MQQNYKANEVKQNKAMINMTPQFQQLIAQFGGTAKNEEYTQLFVPKINNTSYDSSEESSKKSSNSSGSSKNSKKSINQGNESVSTMFTKKMEMFLHQAEGDNMQNMIKRGKHCAEEIPVWNNERPHCKIQEVNEQQQSTQREQQQQQQQVIGVMQSQKNQNNGKQNDKNKQMKITEEELKSGKKETVRELKKRLELMEQLEMLPKVERNRFMMAQKKNAERWDKEVINGKQLAQFMNTKTQDERDKAAQEILEQNEIKQQLKQQKREAKLKMKEEKSLAFEGMIQGIINSGQSSQSQSTKEKFQKKENNYNNTKNGFKPIREEEIIQKGKQVQYGKNQKRNELSSDEEAYKKYTKKQGRKNQPEEYQQQYYKNNQNKYSNYENTQPRERVKNNRSARRQDAAKRTFQSFEPYWSLSATEAAIKDQTVFKGVYLANEKSQHLGRVKSDNIEGNVFINSHSDQNRALHNCVVAFQIIQGDVTKKIKKIDEKTPSVVKPVKSEDETNQGQEESPISSGDSDDSDWEDEPEEQSAAVVANGLAKVQEESKLVARIVYIFENPYANDKIIGYLIPQQQGQGDGTKNKKQSKQKYWFIPKYSKLPRMIPVEFTKEFNSYVEENKIDIMTQYVVAKLRDWRAESFHAEVVVIECLGKRGDIEIECEALIEEFGVYNEDFTPETEEYLQKYRNQLDEKGEFIIPQEEKDKRWDLTNEIICTIDPTDARDLDDALSVKLVKEGVYEIGVHIADVSHFVQADTPLDEDARLRTTSVYLVHRVIPMLPRLLCENLCSLNPNVERLAFTVFFHMNNNGEILPQEGIRIGKSVINSASKFSYDTVQQMIDKKIKSYEELPKNNQPRNGVDGSKMFESIMTLSRLGMARKKSRMSKGVFSIESVKKRFKLNDKLWPVDYVLEDRKEANFVVEEFMLLANQLIGQAMVDKCPSISVLRQHCFPSVEKQTQLNVIAQQFNKHKVDFTNLKSINESIEALKNDPKVTFEQKLFLKRQMYLVLEQALYFVADTLPKDEWRHFALNFDIYTHFTSPIRRYPDLLVHRVMHEILLHGQEATQYIQKDSLLEIMELCNENKAKAKKVSDNCQKIFMCLYLKDHCVESQGMVVSFGGTSMTVFIPDYEIQTTFFFQDYKEIRKTYVEKITGGQSQLKLTFQTKDMPQQHTVYFNAYSPIKVSLTSTDTFPIDYKVKITLPDEFNKKIFHVIQ